MKILHLLKHGGSENGSVNVAVDLACEQSTNGHDVIFASARPDFTETLQAAGVRVANLTEANSVRAAYSTFREIRRLVRSSQPDIVHAHMMSSAVLARAATLVPRRTLITTVHNSFDRHSVLMGLGDRIIAVSEAEREALLKRRFSKKKVVAILNGVLGSRREVIEGDPDIMLRQPAIVSLGGLHGRKAVDDIIKAFAQSAASQTWHLNIVGVGPQFDELKELTSQLGLGDNVHFQGSTKQSSRVLNQASLFVTASLADPCPLAVMEARQAGCAVIGTLVGGIPEILGMGSAGQLVEPRNVPQLASAIDTALASPEALRVWRERAQNGSEYFSVARMTTEHERLYKSTLVRRAGAKRD